MSGLDIYAVCDRRSWAPRGKVVMAGDLDLPGYGRVKRGRMSKEELLALWEDIREKTGLPVQTGALVTGLARERDGMCRVESSTGSLRAAHVLLALGRRGSPRKLELPGEELAKVSYRVLEPEEHAGRHVLVVGGGNSAVETALILADYGGCASVSISYRRERFARARRKHASRRHRSGRAARQLRSPAIDQVRRRLARPQDGNGPLLCREAVGVLYRAFVPD